MITWGILVPNFWEKLRNLTKIFKVASLTIFNPDSVVVKLVSNYRTLSIRLLGKKWKASDKSKSIANSSHIGFQVNLLKKKRKVENFSQLHDEVNRKNNSPPDKAPSKWPRQLHFSSLFTNLNYFYFSSVFLSEVIFLVLI